SNPLSYFNGPTDFGNQLGKAIATRINETDQISPSNEQITTINDLSVEMYGMKYSGGAYIPDSSNRMTFGSYPTSSFTNQGLGGQNYVIQPDLYQQALSSFGSQGFQGLGSYPTSFNSYPGYGFGTGQQTMLPSNGGYTFGNFNNLGGTTYGTNSYGNYGTNTYGIPDPITTGGSTGGSCPYCFGNKGGFKSKKAKRASTTKKN
ncbi:hypothetical protein COOONC_23719, partial [Cooperia oncophora]